MPKGGWRGVEYFKIKCCEVCGQEFKPRGGGQKFCSSACGFKAARPSYTVEAQYKLISGNWKRYCSRLRFAGGAKRASLSQDDILRKLEEQDYKCALSGVELTCLLEKGVTHWTNATIDRIEAGGPYVYDNIQLVCRALNGFRMNCPLDEFIEWCRKVAEYHGRKET